MAIRLSTVPIVVDWSAVQYADKDNCDPPGCYNTNKNKGGNAKHIGWKNATVEGEDGEFDRGGAAVVGILREKIDLEKLGIVGIIADVEFVYVGLSPLSLKILAFVVYCGDPPEKRRSCDPCKQLVQVTDWKLYGSDKDTY